MLNPNPLQALINAIHLLKDRITPQFATAAAHKKELQSLRESIRKRDAQIGTLEHDAGKMQRLLDDAFGAAEKANDKFTAEKHTNQDLQKELSNYKEMLKSKEEEMSGLKGSLQKFKEKVSLCVPVNNGWEDADCHWAHI